MVHRNWEMLNPRLFEDNQDFWLMSKTRLLLLDLGPS